MMSAIRSRIRRIRVDYDLAGKPSAPTFRPLMNPKTHAFPNIPPPALSRNLVRAVLPAHGELSITSEGIDVSKYQPSRPAQVRPKRTILPGFWLRDNCRCAHCVNQDTNQRNFNTFDLPESLRPIAAHMHQDDLHVTWSDNHRSKYPRDFINYYLAKDRRPATADFPAKRLWGNWTGRFAPTVLYKKVMDPSSNDVGVGNLTEHLMRHGFVFVAGTPVDPEATEKLLERIAFVRVTHYGGFYDFIPDLAKADTAYTNLALPAHTDTTYFTEPAGLQAFHLLSHLGSPTTDGERKPFAGSNAKPLGPMALENPRATSDSDQGGQSLLVDGFHAAELLREQDPAAFEVLSKVRLPWHASGNKGIAISPDKRYPVIELDEDGVSLHRVRWNNDDRGVVPLEDRGFSSEQWYEAARKWDSLLRRKQHEYWFQLQPGSVLIFDNWRVLHGRSAFTGVRRICGGYINRDDFVSRWRNTTLTNDHIANAVIG